MFIVQFFYNLRFNMKYFITSIITAFVIMSCSNDKTVADVVDKLEKPKDTMDIVSYAIGYQLGSQMAMDSLKPNFEYLLLGIKKALANDTSFIKQAEMDMTFADWQAARRQKRDEENRMLAEKQIKENAPFLEEAKKAPGAMQLDGGIVYNVIKQGSGKTPMSDELVKVQLTGSLKTGVPFDTMFAKQPTVGPVQNMLPGLKDAILKMTIGSRWKVILPPAKAFGERGFPPVIPPNAVIIYDIELLGIEGKFDPNTMAPQGNQPPPQNMR